MLCLSAVDFILGMLFICIEEYISCNISCSTSITFWVLKQICQHIKSMLGIFFNFDWLFKVLNNNEKCDSYEYM